MPGGKKVTEGLYQNLREIKDFYDIETSKYKGRFPGHDQIWSLDDYGAKIGYCIKKNKDLTYRNTGELMEAVCSL